MNNLKTKQQNDKIINNNGIAALLVVVIVSAVTLIMSYGSLFLGLGEVEMSYINDRGKEAFFIADGCMEEALQRIKMDINYSGGSLNLGSGSCTINISGAGSGRTIVVIGSMGKYNKKIQSDITLSGNVITIDSWKELES